MTATPDLGLDAGEGPQTSSARRADVAVAPARARGPHMRGRPVPGRVRGRPHRQRTGGPIDCQRPRDTGAGREPLGGERVKQYCNASRTAACRPPTSSEALVVPSGARIVSTTAQDAGVDQYDRSIYFELDTKSTDARQVLPDGARRARWSLLGAYPLASGGTEVLAQRPGSDGYEWEVGVVVTTVSPSISPSLAGDGQTSAVIGLRLRLFVVPDSGS